MKTKFFIIVSIMASHIAMAGERECIEYLKHQYKSSQVVYVAFTTLALIPPITLITAWFISDEKKAAKRFLWAKRIVQQAHLPHTNKANAPELMELIDNLKIRSTDIKKRHVKTFIKMMAQQNVGICTTHNKYYNYHDYLKFMKRNSMTKYIYEELQRIYHIKEKSCEDHEETVEDKLGYDISTT